MPWNRTAGFDGQFAVYDLTPSDEPLAAENLVAVDIQWPPTDPDLIYVEVSANPDKTDPNRIIDRVVDPGEPGEPDDD